LSIAEAVCEMYELVEHVADAQGARLVERNSERFILMAGDLEASSTPPTETIEHHRLRICEAITSLLAVAADLHRLLPTTRAMTACSAHLAMGLASGTTALLVARHGGAWQPSTTLAVPGDAVCVATAMAALGAAGELTIDESALWQWAAAARRLPPPSSAVDCGGAPRRAAALDLRTGAFRHSAPPPPPLPPPRAVRPLRRAASFG
jgi:hypothetical protein